MEKVFEARMFTGNINRWEEAGIKSMRTTSVFPDKGHYAIVSPKNKQITMHKELDEHLEAGATVVISNKKVGFIPGWEYTDVRFSLWIVTNSGRFFRLCAFENYLTFLDRWSILYERRHVIVEKIHTNYGVYL